MIVPTGILHAVPFAALQGEDGRSLIERVPLVIAGSTDSSRARMHRITAATVRA